MVKVRVHVIGYRTHEGLKYYSLIEERNRKVKEAGLLPVDRIKSKYEVGNYEFYNFKIIGNRLEIIHGDEQSYNLDNETGRVRHYVLGKLGVDSYMIYSEYYGAKVSEMQYLSKDIYFINAIYVDSKSPHLRGKKHELYKWEEDKYIEQKFNTPNNYGYVKAWLVRIISKGQYHGAYNTICHDNDKKLVEFISLDTNQFVSSYYLDTLLEGANPNVGLNLYGGVESWSIDNKNYSEIIKWLKTQK